MYQRELLPSVLFFASKYPVVTILGPRQSGKTTLAKAAFPHMPYVNLEDLATRALAARDPAQFLEKYPQGAIFDEIQRAPLLLSAIQVAVDRVPSQKGLFILTGSHQLELQAAISQSLAGRTALLTLLPLSLREMRKNHLDLSLNNAILKGGYPRIHRDDLPHVSAHSNYFQTYVERDVRSLIFIKDLLKFERFLRLLASRVGQVVNYASLAGDVGVSAVTIKEWVGVLEASFLIKRLAPYFENFGKRLIKSPKIYFLDTGVLCYLLSIETTVQLESDMLYGNIFENFVVMELFKSCYNQAIEPRFYFYRDDFGKEVDLLYQYGRSLVPIEIKSAQKFSIHALTGLDEFHKIAQTRALKGSLIYGGPDQHPIAPYIAQPRQDEKPQSQLKMK